MCDEIDWQKPKHLVNQKAYTSHGQYKCLLCGKELNIKGYIYGVCEGIDASYPPPKKYLEDIDD